MIHYYYIKSGDCEVCTHNRIVYMVTGYPTGSRKLCPEYKERNLMIAKMILIYLLFDDMYINIFIVFGMTWPQVD